jgi:alpha-D-ribose 1-methylphosphonate 5-triphosphate synthase subunit PhnL
MIKETIKAEIDSTSALDQLSPQCIVEYLSVKYKDQHKELLDAFHDEELIEHIGLDNILESHTEEALAYVRSFNASHEEDGL